MITLKDLAKKLDVSVSTVSKALNDSPEISQLTISRVKALANFYNYKPNKIAQSLRKNQTKTIGVIIPNILNRFFAKVLHGIQEEATRLGYNIIVCITNESLEKEKDSIKLLVDGSVDGFILAVSEETQLNKNYTHFDQLSKEQIPMVMFDRVLDQIACDKVIIDDLNATYEATNSLINEGRKHIVFITAIDNLNVGKFREAGFKKAIENSKAEVTPYLLVLDKEDDEHERLTSFFSSHGIIDAVVAADNISGTMAINLARSLGREIPKDIAVLGFADEIVSNMSVPKLSTINQNAEEIGIRSVDLLINRLRNSSTATAFKTVVVPTSLVHNGSDLL